MYVGDLNDDEMDDLYCHTTGGETSVAISTVKGETYLDCNLVIPFVRGGRVVQNLFVKPVFFLIILTDLNLFSSTES